jgi:hypothetical protein
LNIIIIKIELKDPEVVDGFVDISKYGKIEIGLHGPLPNKVILGNKKKNHDC